MKNKLFNAFVIFVGVMIVFTFLYVQTDTKKSSKKLTDTLAMHTNVKSDFPSDVEDESAKIPLPSQKYQIPQTIQEDRKEDKHETMEKVEVLHPTIEAMEAHTQEIYEMLQPDDHEETIEQAKQAFETLDEHVLQVDEMIQSHKELAIQDSINMEDESIPQEEEEYEMELPIID